MAPSSITKEHFLANLENALNQLMLKHILANADAATQTSIKADIREFIQQNVTEYSLEELTETFISAETTVGLFLEYQEAKRIVGEETTTSTLSSPRPLPATLFGMSTGKRTPIFPSTLAGASHGYRNGMGARHRLPNGQWFVGRSGTRR